MEKEKIMSIVENAAMFVMGMLSAIIGCCTARVALDMIHDGNPVGWVVFAVVGSYIAIVLIKKILEKRLAVAEEADG